jgi:hypothetical protein
VTIATPPEPSERPSYGSVTAWSELMVQEATKRLCPLVSCDRVRETPRSEKGGVA